MPKYGLDGYTLTVTQNSVIDMTDSGDSTDKITIALQENRIEELQQQISQREEEISGLKAENSGLKDVIDYTEVAEKAAKVFPELSNVRCGSASGTGGAHAILIAETQIQPDENAQQYIRNWLTAETGNPEAELYITYNPPETAESTLESTAEPTAEAE